MHRQTELGVVRAAYAKQILAAAEVAGNARLETALSATRREDFLGAGPCKRPNGRWPTPSQRGAGRK
jgi:protein-L-isoaspartate(D-aspartate) O-methyltransferase